MKTKTFVVLTLAALSLFVQSVSAQNHYIETTTFQQYLAKPNMESIHYRYNAFSQPILIFKSVGDSLIGISLIDYDNVGNMTKRTTLLLWLDESHKFRYITNAKMDEKSFQEIVQQIMDRLKKV